jgi:L,D-peptidoglycan transpeptidase YkuD (ErfK/YbiS/YcfS/YnhG family)
MDQMSTSHIFVRSLCQSAVRGWLTIGWQRFPCALGRAGRHHRKVEGDGRTPIGSWRLRTLYYRTDRCGHNTRPHNTRSETTRPQIMRPRIGQPGLSLRPIRSNDGWCDGRGDRNYNRAIKRPYPASSETLWRDDQLYDLIVVLDHNERPRVQGGGSAIFMHVARPDFTPTEGCVALKMEHLRRVLATIRPRSRLRIMA